MQAQPGHFQLMAALRRAAYTDDHRLLFVAAGLDPERPLSEQNDSFWWGGTGFSPARPALWRFRPGRPRHDRSQGGPATSGPYSVTIDAGLRLGGPLMCRLPFVSASGDVDRFDRGVIASRGPYRRNPQVSEGGYGTRWGMARLATHGSLDRADMRFIRRCMKAPLLSRDREQELALAWRDRHDQGALHELILAYSRLVVAAAVRLARLWPAAGRPHPGRQYRPDGGGHPLRSRSRHPLLHLCRLVDPRRHAGSHPAQLVDRAHRHHRRAEEPVLQSPPPARPHRPIPRA